MRLDVLYRKAVDTLAAAQVPDAKLDAWYLLEAAAGVTRSDLYVHPEREIDPDREALFLKWIGIREKRVPLQRILGEQEFMGISFLVGEEVLIPRQDTEILVEEVLRILKDDDKVLDMCTGTGCIGLSLAALSDKAIHVTCTDISEEALSVAEQNRLRLEVTEGRARILKSDLYAELAGDVFSVIVSNPPYIRPEVIETLEPEVRDHDPRLALDGGPDGLVFYRKITEEAGAHLVNGGQIFFEIGYDQGDEVAGILKQNGFENIRIIPDLTGLNRVVTGTKLC